MKKLTTALRRLGIFTLTISLLLTGCSKNAEDTDSDTETTGDTQSETTEAPTTTEEEPEEPSTMAVLDESVYKLALINISSKVCESEDEETHIRREFDGDWATDWTGVTVWAYSFVLEGVTPETSFFSPDIYNKSTGEDLSDIAGKSYLSYANCHVYDIETEYSSLYDVERDIMPLIFYTTEEIPVENLEFQIHISPDGGEWVDAILSVNASIDDVSLNPSMGASPLLKINDNVYLCASSVGVGGGTGPDGTGYFDYYSHDIRNLSYPYSNEAFSVSDIEGLQYVDKETLEEIEPPISGCSPLWDIYGQNQKVLKLGYYSDTEIPGGEDSPLGTGYEKITIDGSDIIIY